MAKKQVSREQFSLPPQLRRPLLAVFCGIALLLGLTLLWQAWQGWRQSRIEPELNSLREQLAGQIAQEIAALRGRLDGLVADSHLRADLAAGAFEDATSRAAAAWREAESVELLPATLDSAFGDDLSRIGFARLALLSAASAGGVTVSDIVGTGDAMRLGLASPVLEEGAPLAIAFVTLSLDNVTQPLRSAALPGGYIDLRSGNHVIESRGGPRPVSPVLTPVPGLTLQIASGAPLPSALLGYSPLVLAGIALILLGLGTLLAKRLRDSTASAAVVAEEPTFGEVLKQTRVEAPVAARPAAKAKPTLAHVDRSIFRAYDIRGVVGQTLDEGVARLIGQSVGTMMRERGLREIVVGRDGRLSGPALSTALTEGLRRAGCDVIDIGQAPTPLVYYATFQLNTGCGIAVTGSHNPPDYNGFKVVVGGETLSGQTIQDLYARIAENRLEDGGGGGLQVMDLSDDYVQRVAGDIQLERRLKVVVDAGNGVAGALAPQLLESIGAEVIPLHCEVDGEFPNHHPDPSDPHNLADLITFVARFNADLGLAFDGDGDRLGVVTREGEIIYPDRLLMLFAQDVLSRNPGATVIYDVKCTGHLAGQILRHGGSPVMWKTGHSLIKAKMKETEAELAGEMSGHFFFRERWYGFDDGLYSAARLLEILAADDRSAGEIFAELPKGVSTPELKIAMAEGEHYAFIERFREQARFEGAKIATIDGIRADWPDGWGLVRCSNTTPSLVLRFDADSAAALARIQAVFRAQLLALEPNLALPF